ncbi:MAG: DUF488 family protein [Candidatus Heimdallarchaeota archaeon]
MDLFTIGHSTRTLDELIRILQTYGIKTLVDVRRFPGSKKFPHFNRENLEKVLPKHSIRYCWLGESLGGFRKGGYKEYIKTEEFEHGINQLLTIAKKARTAIMCSEIVWFRCHRNYISEHLVRIEHQVIHIVNEKRKYEHKLRKNPKVS